MTANNEKQTCSQFGDKSGFQKEEHIFFIFFFNLFDAVKYAFLWLTCSDQTLLLAKKLAK